MNIDTLHVAGFSGGASSAVMSQIVAEEHPGKTVLLFHDTLTEPADNARFRAEVAAHIGLPINESTDGRDIWQVFEDEGYLGNGRNTMCSRILKQERSLAFLKAHTPAIIYVGYTIEETARAQRTFARYDKHGITARFPLLEQRITKQECHDKIEKCWGIELPKNYEWAEHANCIPCVKGKKAYWGLIYMFEREAWERAAKAEDDFGFDIMSEGSLRELLADCIRLANAYLEKRKAEKKQYRLFDTPCECAA